MKACHYVGPCGWQNKEKAMTLNRSETGINVNMKRDRPFDGQEHTDEGVRGMTEIKGVTLRDLQDAYVRACCLASGAAHPDNMPFYHEAEKGENARLSTSDIYRLKNKPDGMAVFHNLSTEIEKLMGIFPNIPDVMPPLGDSRPPIETDKSVAYPPREGGPGAS